MLTSSRVRALLVLTLAAWGGLVYAQGGVARPRPVAVQPAAQAPAPAVASAAAERALLDQYCVSCHNTKAKAAGMDSSARLTLDDVDLTAVGSHARTLELVVRKMRAGMMPPAGVRRPDAPTYAGMIAWLEGELDRNAVPHMVAPGPHRLNRAEYANAIKDLLDLDIEPAKYLPSDDSTSGFDNIAGALGISSTLVEAYVSAAQKISRLAVGARERASLVIVRAPEDSSQNYHVEGLPLGTRGGMLVNHLFPSDGDYVLSVLPLYGDNQTPVGFGSVPCERIEISVDGEQLEVMDWRGGGQIGAASCRGETRAAVDLDKQGPDGFVAGKMDVRFTTTAGQHAIGVTFLQTNLAPVLDFERQFARATIRTGVTPGYTFFPHVGSLRIEGPFNARQAADSPSLRKVFVCRPATAAEERPCARRIIATLATTAYRRPAAAADVNPLFAYFEQARQGKDFATGIELVLERILASPQFVYRIERTDVAPAVVRTNQSTPARKVADIDLASRLSYFLWSRGPDATLLKIASEGRLNDPVVLEQQARRMLKDPRAAALTTNFAGQWLNLRGLDAHAPLAVVYPDFDDPLRQAMRTEVELLFDSVVREDRNVLDLLTADYTFLNQRLAMHYGIPNITGSRFRRVTLGPELDIRRGLLGKGAFLTTTAKPDRTSPVTRGKWIMANLLGMSPPDPPPNVPPLPERSASAAGSTKPPTMRMKMQEHRVRVDCVQCHRLMDPIGLAMENFDGIGLWRTEDEGTPIDAKDQLFDNTRVDGPAAVRDWVVSKYGDVFVRVAVEKLMTYALGRGLDYQDMPVVRGVARDAARANNRFSALVLGVVKSELFRMSMTEEPSAAGQRAAR